MSARLSYHRERKTVTNDTLWLLSYQPKYHTECQSHFQGQENSRRSACSLSWQSQYEKRAPCVKYQQLIQPATGDRLVSCQTNKLKVNAAWQKLRILLHECIAQCCWQIKKKRHSEILVLFASSLFPLQPELCLFLVPPAECWMSFSV